MSENVDERGLKVEEEEEYKNLSSIGHAHDFRRLAHCCKTLSFKHYLLVDSCT